MRRTRILIATTALALLAQSAASANAGEAAAHGTVPATEAIATATAESVSSVAPSTSTAAGRNLEEVEATQALGATVLRAGDVVLPQTGDGSLTIEGSSINIGMPAEVATGKAQVTDTDMVVYQGTDIADPSVVVASAASSVAVQVVIPDETAPSRYTFEIGGALPVLREDGRVELRDSAGAVIGEGQAPWAVDATGQAVPTRYEVHGQSLVQVVDFTSASAFPIVADPDFIFFAKCAAGVAMFIAENAAIATKFWKVFKSAKAFAKLMKSIRGMSKKGRIGYVKAKLGSIAGDASGISDLVSRCTP